MIIRLTVRLAVSLHKEDVKLKAKKRWRVEAPQKTVADTMHVSDLHNLSL
jgi:hypothetical protein